MNKLLALFLLPAVALASINPYRFVDGGGEPPAEETLIFLGFETDAGNCTGTVELGPSDGNYSQPAPGDFTAGNIKSASTNGYLSRDSGGTPSSGTGPSSAYEGSYYLYTEATGGGTVAKSRWYVLLPGTFNFATAHNLSYAIHNNSTTSGGETTFGIQWQYLPSGANETTGWVDIGSGDFGENTDWDFQTISTGAIGNGVKIRFFLQARDSTSDTWRNDIAVDNIRVWPPLPTPGVSDTDAVAIINHINTGRGLAGADFLASGAEDIIEDLVLVLKGSQTTIGGETGLNTGNKNYWTDTISLMSMIADVNIGTGDEARAFVGGSSANAGEGYSKIYGSWDWSSTFTSSNAVVSYGTGNYYALTDDNLTTVATFYLDSTTATNGDHYWCPVTEGIDTWTHLRIWRLNNTRLEARAAAAGIPGFNDGNDLTASAENFVQFRADATNDEAYMLQEDGQSEGSDTTGNDFSVSSWSHFAPIWNSKSSGSAPSSAGSNWIPRTGIGCNAFYTAAETVTLREILQAFDTEALAL